MTRLEQAVERLKSEGHTSEEIRNALDAMKKEALSQPSLNGSLDDYLDLYEDGEEANAD